MEAMLAVRHEQIFRFGHTLEADQAKPLMAFAQDLRAVASAILDDIQFHKSTRQIERRTVKLGALAMALFDRLQAEKGKE